MPLTENEFPQKSFQESQPGAASVSDGFGGSSDLALGSAARSGVLVSKNVRGIGPEADHVVNLPRFFARGELAAVFEI